MVSVAVEISSQEYYLNMEVGFLIKKPSYQETIFRFETTNLIHFYTAETDTIYGNSLVAYWFPGMESKIANRNYSCGRLDISQEIVFVKRLRFPSKFVRIIHFPKHGRIE